MYVCRVCNVDALYTIQFIMIISFKANGRSDVERKKRTK